MADPAPTPTTPPPGGPPQNPPPPAVGDKPTDPPPDPAPGKGDPGQLGDAGKRALEAERAAVKAAKKEAADLRAQLEELEAERMSESDKALEAAKAEGRTEAMAAVNQRLLAAEIRAAAASRVDPEWVPDVERLLDLDDDVVSDDGTVDTKAIESAIDSMVEQRPALRSGATPGPANPDNGARGGGVQQLTRADLKTMTPDEITQAQQDGRMADLLAGQGS